jgi:hypothetical protein
MVVGVTVLLSGLLALPTRSAGQGAERIGTVLAIDGVAEVRTQDAREWERLRFRDAIFVNDTVRTFADSKAKVLLRDDSIMTLAERSEMQFTALLLTEQQRRTVVSLFFGKVRVLTTRLFGAGSSTEVHTPNAVAGVRGSDADVGHVPENRETSMFCRSGDCYKRDPVDPTKVFTVPENHIAVQVGGVLPSTTREATPTERQAAVQGTQITEQVKGEVQTTAAARQEQALELRGPVVSERREVVPTVLPPSTRIETAPGRETAMAPRPGVLLPEIIFGPAAGVRPGPGADNPQLTQPTPDCTRCSPIIENIIRESLLKIKIQFQRQ